MSIVKRLKPNYKNSHHVFSDRLLYRTTEKLQNTILTEYKIEFFNSDSLVPKNLKL